MTKDLPKRRVRCRSKTWELNAGESNMYECAIDEASCGQCFLAGCLDDIIHNSRIGRVRQYIPVRVNNRGAKRATFYVKKQRTHIYVEP
jgi:hypothetical protein